MNEGRMNICHCLICSWLVNKRKIVMTNYIRGSVFFTRSLKLLMLRGPPGLKRAFFFV